MEQKKSSKLTKTSETVLSISIGIISIVILLLAIMQITEVWDDAINVFEPLLGVLMVINGFRIYKHNKLTALFNFGVAIVIFIITVVVFINR